jgi:CRP/FNR family cyclic AMP-dependent transcriptional regulator
MIELLRGIPIFSGLYDSQLQNLSNVCVQKVYPAGTVIFQENEQGTVFYIVLSGSVKIFTSNKSGDNKILSICSSGDSFGELSLLDGNPRSATAQTIETTKLLTLSTHSFHSLLRENFEINLQIIQQLSKRLREMNQQVHDLTYMDARKRVIKVLIKLVESHGTRIGNLVKIRINLNYDEFSQFAGVPKQVLFRVFEDLQLKKILQVSDNEFRFDITQLLKK